MAFNAFGTIQSLCILQKIYSQTFTFPNRPYQSGYVNRFLIFDPALSFISRKYNTLLKT